MENNTSIEFFCGNKSFSNFAKSIGYRVFTLDINKKFEPDLCMDILNFRVSMLPKGFQKPDVVWFSPPCEKFSHANRSKDKDLTLSILYVKKSLKLIKEFLKINPNLKWVLENPQTGTLKKQKFMDNLPFTDVSYCQYGLPYRKQTRLWNNANLKLLTCKKDCEFMEGKKHIMSVGNGRKKYTKKSYSREEKYHIPQILILEILKQLRKKEVSIPPTS